MVEFDKPVYLKMPDGRVFQILRGSCIFVIKLVADIEVIKIFTNDLDCARISFNKDDFSRIDLDCIEYVLNLGIRKMKNVPEKFHDLFHYES